MKIRYLLAIALIIPFCLSSKGTESIFLVKDSQSRYRIIIPSAAGLVEKRAAAILQSAIRKMSGAELPVESDLQPSSPYEIVIGKTNRSREDEWKQMSAGLNEDGYALQTRGNRLFITGGTGKGVIYGVTGFLEDHLGCGYYAPGAEFMPASPTIQITPLNERQCPLAAIRIINGSFPDDEDYKDWRKLATVADKWNDGSWKGYYVHTFRRLVSPDQYFATHPEYFALINGRRIPNGQLCLSNPDVFAITIKKLKEEMAQHPGVRYWSVSQNDTYDNCQCDACRKCDSLEGSPSGLLLDFVNRVAAEFPDKIITTLAYQYTRKPPLRTRPAANVMITLCTIELNRSLPIETDPGSASFREDIAGWSRICSNLMVWDYEVQFTNYLAPFPLFHTLQPNLLYFTGFGVQAHFQQCNAVHGVEFAELKSYLLSKLLWNPHANSDSIIDDFMRGYYRKAAPFIRAYFDLLHAEARRSGQGLDIYGTPVWNAETFLSQKNIGRYNQIFDQAEEVTRNDLEALERVKVDRLCIQFAELEISKTDLFGERGWYQKSGGEYILRPERKQLLEDFYSTCTRNHFDQMNENGLTAESYYKSTLRFIDVQVKGNLAFGKKVTCNPLPAPKYSGSGPGMLTNGVRGTEDYKINWLGWEGEDVTITIDLDSIVPVNEIIASSLQYPKSWILHPLSVSCSLSSNGRDFDTADTVFTETDLQKEPMFRDFIFHPSARPARFIRLQVTGTKTLPSWHNWEGSKSWVFLDEVIVK